MDLFNRDLLNEIGQKLIKQGYTISCAESVSSGLLQYALGSIENASEFYQGGITVYNTPQKTRHLHIEPIHALSVDAVSQKVANEMAAQCSQLFLSNWSIGITGYASASPESGNELYAYYCIAKQGQVSKCGKLVPDTRDPDDVKQYYVKEMLLKLKEALEETAQGNKNLDITV